MAAKRTKINCRESGTGANNCGLPWGGPTAWSLTLLMALALGGAEFSPEDLGDGPPAQPKSLGQQDRQSARSGSLPEGPGGGTSCLPEGHGRTASSVSERTSSADSSSAGSSLPDVAGLVAASSSERPAQAGSPLPEGVGLAAKYPGDRNLHRDPAVLFAEDFEAACLAEVIQHWTEAKNPRQEGIRLVEDAPAGSPGRQAVEMIAHPDRDTSAHLYKLLPRGVDRCFARF